MRRDYRHILLFLITMICVSAFLLWARAVPMAIGQWIMHAAASFVLLFLFSPLIILTMTLIVQTWPLWTKQLLLSVVGWTIMCGAIVIVELQLSSEGMVVGCMAVIYAIAVPWLVIGNHLATKDPS